MQDDCLMVNIRLIKILGPYCAILLTELINCYIQCQNKGELEKGIFFATTREIKENTGLDEKAQREELWKLKDLGVLEELSLGLSPKKHFKFNEEVLWGMIQG